MTNDILENVRKLRDITGAGMMDCRKALLAVNNDLDAAVEYLRKSGKMVSAQKAARIAAEGIVIMKKNADCVAMLEVNCETDFVARDQEFRNFAEIVLQAMIDHKTNDISVLKTQTVNINGANTTIEELREQLIAKIKENINIRRGEIILTSADSSIGAYLHSNRIGVFVQYTGSNEVLGKDLAMHIAASNPKYVHEEDIPKAILDKEREILQEQTLNTLANKSKVDLVVNNKVKDYAKKITLIKQPFVKELSITIEQLLKDNNNAKILKFTRFEVGEGMEKKEVNFAEEVASQIKTK